MSKRMFILTLMAIMMITAFTPHSNNSASAAPTTYYVSPTGSDSNDGMSLSTPFKTIQKAANVMVAGDLCYIRGGTYRETVIPVHSGTSGNTITFQNYNGEQVTVSGLDPVTGWSLDAGSVYKAVMNGTLGTRNQIFVDGVMMNLARWPNQTGTLTQPTLATVGSVDPGLPSTTIIDSHIPGGDDFWNGAQLWIPSGVAYWAYTSTVTDYDAATHKLTFNSLPVSGSYDPVAGNKYFLSGIKAALDTQKEWWYDSNAQLLYLWAPGGADPSTQTVEAKKRDYAFDLSGRSYLDITGIDIFGASINTDVDTSHVTIRDMKAEYISHDNAAGAGYPISIKGSDIEIRNSELAYSSSAILVVEGSDNRVINNYIHDGNYMATSNPMIYTKGNRLLVSHNTGTEAGRAVIGGGATDSRIQYNDFSFAGRLTKDLGVTYMANTDGQNTVLSYNKIHDNAAPSGVGIYFDQATQNYIIHHNVVWNTPGAGILLGTPSNYKLVYNNSVDGSAKNWTAVYGVDMYATHVMNNIFKLNGLLTSNPPAWMKNNLFSTSPGYVNPAPGGADYNLQSTSPAVNGGMEIAGITDGYGGAAPDQGAYEYGNTAWKAGHDFANPPNPTFTTVDTTYMNRVKNGGFENGDFTGWTKTFAQTAQVVYDPAWSRTDKKARLNNYGLQLGTGIDAVEQTVTGLSPNTSYTLSGWAKVEPGESVSIGVSGYDGAAATSRAVTDTGWTQVTMDFITGASGTSATIWCKKTGAGTGYVYCDDIGLIRKVPDLYAAADAYVQSGTFGNDNYGTSADLKVKATTDADTKRASFLQFDVSGISGTISSAKLKLYVSYRNTTGPVEIFPVADDTWTEGSITWNNKPTEGAGKLASASITAAGAWYTFDITSYVQSEHAGDKIVSLCLKDSTNANALIHLGSRESVNWPVLEIVQ
ncbi:DUF7594 domain-containing protein [Paenibacillus contaminans]|nr:DNRLRE domain-containing protein [Paenibacillus contaminans]